MINSVQRDTSPTSPTRRRSRGLLVLVASVLLTSALIPSHIQAVDTSLDPGFGKNGKVTTKFPGGFSEARAVVVQTDGKIVVAGSNSGSGNSDFALARYNQDGSPDFTFGEAGKVATDFSVSSDAAFSLVLQPDGKIIAVGAVNNFGFGIARYNTDGSLDPTFGTGGKVTTRKCQYQS